ncbi:MAG: hypothetical protein GF404_01615 [candidate division Zixibacteria bacterium]|nr:hypothetical protein [candidate division Zixibacteria bacterium]
MIKLPDYSHIIFKKGDLYRQFNLLKDTVRKMGIELSHYLWTTYAVELVITCVLRNKDTGSQHSCYEAFDARARTMAAEMIGAVILWGRDSFPRSDKIRRGDRLVPALPIIAHGEGHNFHFHCSQDREVS